MRCFASLIVVILAALPAQAQQKPPERLPDYYPLKKGATWVYRLEVNGVEMGTLTNRIAKTEKIDNQSLARLESIKDGKALATEHLSSTAKGIFRHRLNGAEIAPPMQLLKLPFKSGDTWEVATKVGGQMLNAKCKVTTGMIEVPAGKFKTVIVDIEGDDGMMKLATTYWFAADVGIVRQTASVNGIFMILDLKKFEAGK